MALSAVFALLPSAHGVVIVNDTWKDGTRTDPAQPVYSENGVDADADGDIESLWYKGGTSGATLAPAAAGGPLVGSTHNPVDTGLSTSSTSWTTYFAAEATPVSLTTIGDSMQVKWVFSMAGIANDAANNGQGFRLGVVDSPPANRLAADGSPAANVPPANYFGYATFLNLDQTLRRNGPLQLLKRNADTSGTQAFLGTSANWIGLGQNGATNDPGYVNGTTYTYTMTLTHNATDGLDIVSRMEGTGLGPTGQGFLEVSFTDPTPSTLSFDTFGLRPGSEATSATTFNTTLFRVEKTTAGGTNANFDGLGVTDGADFLIWQKNNGTTGTGTLATGDANNDHNVDGADLTAWRGQFGSPVVGAAGAAPEPSSLAIGLLAVVGGAVVRRRR